MPVVVVAAIVAAAAAGAAYAAGFALMTALVIAAATYAATTLLMPSMDAFNASDTGQSLTVRDQTGVVPVSYGTKIKSGVIESYSDVSSDGHTLIIMGTFGFGEIGGVSKIWIDNNLILKDDAPIFQSGMIPQEYIRKPHSDNVRIEIDTGSDNALTLPQQYGKITPEFKGTGLAKYCITIGRALSDGELLNVSPSVSFEIAGIKINDLSTGSFTSSSNGPSILYDYLCNDLYGFKVLPEDIDLDSFIDTAREVKALQLDTNGSIKPNDTPKQIIQNICSSFGGVLIYAYGKYYLRRDRAEISRYTITDEEITSACEISTSQSSSAKNTINVKWSDPLQNWSSVVTQVQDSAQVLKDSRVDDTSLDLPFSTDIDDVKYIGSIELNKSKYLQKLQMRIKGLYDLMPMDVITVNSDTYGILNKKYRISTIAAGVNADSINQADYVLLEYDDSVYTADHDVVYNPDSVIDQSTQVLEVSDFNIVFIGQSNLGYQYRLNWSLQQDPHRLGIRVRYREQGSTTAYTSTTLQRDATGSTLTVPNSVEYEVQVQTYGMLTNSAWVGTTAVGGAGTYALPAVQELVLINHSDLGSTYTQDLNFVFKWKYNKNQNLQGTDYTVQHYIDHYRVTINGIQYSTKTESFEYSFDLNRAAGLSRTLNVQVQAVGLGGVLSEAVVLTATNPQHLAPLDVDISAGWDAPTISWSTATEPDRAGTVLEFWRDSALIKTVYTSEIESVQPQIPAGAYDVRLAHYDHFGTDALLYTGWFQLEQSAGIPSSALDPEIQDAINTVTNIESISDSKIIDVFEHVEKVSRQINNVAGSVSAKVTDISSQFGDLKVKVQNLSNIVISSDGTSTADQIELIELDLGNIKADISSTKNLIVSNDSAYSAKFDSINASLNNNSAAIQSVSQSLVTKDTATNIKIDSVSTSVQANKSTYDNFVKTQTNSNSSTANSITQLSSRVGTAESLIQTIQSTNATQDAAISSISMSLQAKYDDSISKINAVSSTEAAHNAASASAISQLSSRVGSTESSISTLSSTQASDRLAASTYTTQVKSELNGTIASINTTASTLVSQMGQIKSQYTLQVQADGVVAGYSILVDGTLKTSAIAFQADKFSINTANGKLTPFAVIDSSVYADNLIVRGANIQNGSIGTAHIQSASIGTVHIQCASITSGMIQDASISSAKIAGTISSTNYAPGVAGWSINKTGGCEFNSVTARGTIYAENGYFKGEVFADKITGGVMARKVRPNADIALTTSTGYITVGTINVTRGMARTRTMRVYGTAGIGYGYASQTFSGGADSSGGTVTVTGTYVVRVLLDGAVAGTKTITMSASNTSNVAFCSATLSAPVQVDQIDISIPADSATHVVQVQLAYTSITGGTSRTGKVGSNSGYNINADMWIDSGDLA